MRGGALKNTELYYSHHFFLTSYPPGPPALPGSLTPAPLPSGWGRGWRDGLPGRTRLVPLLGKDFQHTFPGSSFSAKGAAFQAQLEDAWKSQKHIHSPQNSRSKYCLTRVTCIFCVENKKCSLSIRARPMQVTKMLMQEGFSFVGLKSCSFFLSKSEPHLCTGTKSLLFHA